MTSSRKNALSYSIPSATESVLPNPYVVTLPPRLSNAETDARYTIHSTRLDQWILFLQEKTRFREFMSGLTHCFAAVLAVIGFIFLVLETTKPLRPWHFVTFSVFGISMILLFVASTLFHWLPLSDKNILQLRKLDHIMIFIFIAATYTPFCLIPFRGTFGWGVFACIWSIAILGALFKIYWFHVSKSLCLSIYFFAGYFSLVAMGHIIRGLQPWAIFWLAAGGLSYTIGAVFYALDKSDKKPPLFGYHELFHIFVMCGSSAHFWVIYHYINMFN